MRLEFLQVVTYTPNDNFTKPCLEEIAYKMGYIDADQEQKQQDDLASPPAPTILCCENPTTNIKPIDKLIKICFIVKWKRRMV